MSKTQQQYRNEFLNMNKAAQEEQIKASNQIYDSQKKQATDVYNGQIVETEESYDDLFRENEVQRIINERRIAENMANLGLTDSGLNRTQQTAVQLSYANQKGKLNTERQKAVDSLRSKLSSAITEIENNRISSEAGIKNTFEQNANTYAQDMYKADVEAETKRIESANKALESYYSSLAKMQTQNSYIIKANGALLSREYEGTLASNGVGVYADPEKPGYLLYVDSKSGKQTSLPKGINPYVGGDKVHKDLLDKNGKYDESKAFKNGYQPNNINGKKLKAVKGSDGKNLEYPMNGNTQSVWSYDNGKTLWVWDGLDNRYHQLT